MLSSVAGLALVLLLVGPATAHPHHHAPEDIDSSQPIDAILYLHITVQLLSWGVLFPSGYVLGRTRSPFHVPLQASAIVLSFFGYYLGHHHGGREFPETAHGHFATLLFWLLISQGAIGTFLKLHLRWGADTLRPILVTTHGILGVVFLVTGWTQIVLGFIAGLGICFGDHLGQCLAHFIMGSSFIAYGLVLVLMIYAGASFLTRHRLSQEYLDSWVIMIWGFINTFTEHDFLSKSNHWSHKDMQHTSLGVMWWMGGALGVWLGRNQTRNLVPAGIIALTGYAMSAHEQSSMISTKVHTAFGYILIIAGISRAVEICFVMREQNTFTPVHVSSPSPDNDPTHSATVPLEHSAFQHVTPFFLVLGGLMFMSATEEQLVMIENSGMDHVTYTLLIVSAAFIMYLYSLLLLSLYSNSGQNAESGSSARILNAVYSIWMKLRNCFSRKSSKGDNSDYSDATYELVSSPPQDEEQNFKVFDADDIDDPEHDDRYWRDEEEEAQEEEDGRHQHIRRQRQAR